MSRSSPAAHAPILPQVLFCALLWGAAFPLIKLTYAEWTATPLALCLFFAGLRFTLAGAGILAFCRGIGSRLREANKPLLIGLTLTQTCLQYVAFYTGMSISSGVLGALLIGCGSFWWMLLAPPLLGSAPARARDWIALGICAVGIAFAVYAPGAGSGRVVLGTLCFLAASLAGALGLIIMKPMSKTADAKTATGASLFLGGLVLLALGASEADTFFAQMTPRVALYTAALAFISAVAFSIWNRLAHTHPVNVLAGYRFIIPLSGAVQSTLLVAGEFPGPGLLAGGCLIIGALYWLSRPRSTAAISGN